MTLPTPDSSGKAGVAGAQFHVGLGGRFYIMDLRTESSLVERSIPLLRNQADTGDSVSEQSLNPEDLVRRAVDSCHHGTGQTYRDRPDSDPYRFRDATGIDVWTKWQLSLLWATKSIKARTDASASGPALVQVGAYLYLIDDNELYYTNSDLSGSVSWTSVSGVPGATDASSMATNGDDVYVAYEASGIYTTTAGDASASSLFTGQVRYVWFAKNRLLCANGGGVLYNPTDFTTPPNALPTALVDLGATWTWSHVAEGPAHIYIGGFRNNGVGGGDRSVIYKTAAKPDGTALDIPTPALTLPDGELLSAMCGYMGYILLGIDSNDAAVGAVRLCEIQSDGNLIMGPKLEGPYQSVYAFEPQDHFVWFTWRDSDNQTGLGRLDLAEFTQPLAPAYARDLMYNPSGAHYAGSMTSIQGRRVFSLGSSAVVCEDRANRVATGDIYFGKTTFGIPDNKVAMYVDVSMTTTSATEGTVTVYVSVDGAARVSYGSLTASGTVDLSGLTGKEFEVSLQLARGSTVTNTPVVTRVTLRSFMAPRRTKEFILPLIVKPRVTTVGGVEAYYTTRDEINAIEAMIGTVVVLQMGTLTEYVQIKDYEWRPDFFDEESGQFGGICIVRAQVVV